MNGWAVYDMNCPQCGHSWLAIEPVKKTQLECPECGRVFSLREKKLERKKAKREQETPDAD